MSSTIIENYIKLIAQFVNEEIDAISFERNYLKMFKSQPDNLSEKEYLVLDGLFSDIDAFCSDPSLRDEYDLNEEQLRDQCKKALKKLRTVTEL